MQDQKPLAISGKRGQMLRVDTKEDCMRRMPIMLFLVTLATISISAPLRADGDELVGKKPFWETWSNAPKKGIPSSIEGEAIETPNQRRARLGLPIEASFSEPAAGVAEETPNQRRFRLSSGPSLAKAERPSYETLISQQSN